MYLFEPDLLYGTEQRPYRKEANPEKNGLKRTSSPDDAARDRYETDTGECFRLFMRPRPSRRELRRSLSLIIYYYVFDMHL